ncbi:DMT family transporter [Haliangium sp.]|uniref:DMT family transporter n=1 Tax=Haliangium sp. TaxID=2663208 RepID=UPI003D11A4E8
MTSQAPTAAAPDRAAGHRLAYLAIAATIICWASAFVGVRAAVVHISPGPLALFRFLVASAVLAGMMLAARARLPQPSDLVRISFVGLIGITIYNLGLNYGSQFLAAGSVSFIINTAPIFTAIFARLLLGERIPKLSYFGFAISFTGVIIIFSGENLSSVFQPVTFIILLAALAHSLYFVLQKPILTRYSALQVVSVAVWAGTLFMIPFALDTFEQVSAAPSSAIWTVVYLGVFPGALAFAAWSYALSRLTASNAAIFLYAVPPTAILIGWVALDELPSAMAIAGGGVALSGVAFFNYARNRATRLAAQAQHQA